MTDNHWKPNKFRKPTFNELVQAHSKMFPGRLTDKRTQCEGPCPVCGGTNRFSIQKSDGSVWCRHCKPDGSPEGKKAYTAIVVSFGLFKIPFDSSDRAEPLELPAASGTAGGGTDERSVAEKVQAAERLWNSHSAVPIAGTKAETWLTARGIHVDLQPLRFKNDAFHYKLKQKLPCILAKIIDPETGEFKGVLRTYFTLAEDRRLFLGNPQGGGILAAGKIGAARIIVTEGVEDAGAIVQSGISETVWATGGAVHMPFFEAGKNVKYVKIACDNDNNGREAANKLADRCKKSNPPIRGRIIFPIQNHKDWNSMLMAGEAAQILKKLA